ncbi:hypothetical protein CHS0354_036027 [Potamilus streckersoni]|uniref:Lipocalin/cytosolic fatty-acid binding domain-containing protein n=1 Tax=Potamilus streckersoni TaxID=2493646 RepID=A0AAE0RMQ2_9BIVA|nr:hypothetical protein CHS0354_036027 [Potamilus streckersoni]
MDPVVCCIVSILLHQFLLWNYQVNAECQIDSFQVQENFDFTKYLGKWYEQKWLAQSYIPQDQLFQDYTHYYVLNPNSSVTIFISGRSPENISMCFHYVALLELTTVPGKFRFTRYWNQSYSDAIDYWVMNTDYDNYAFVYGCEKQNAQGQCTYQDSWVWSRTPTLPARYWALVNNSMQAVCVNYSRYLDTQQKNECTVDCFVQSFQVQPNFNINQYVGKWYEQKWLAQSYIPQDQLFQDYTHYYVLNPNSSVTIFISGRSPENVSMCFHYVALLEQTTVPGKFRFTRYWNQSYSDAIDYWVMNTDYDNYAFIYGCEKRNAQGQCTYQDSWVWSRTPNLPARYWALVNNSMQAVCINYSRYLDTQQKNDCFVQSFQVQPNFNINSYLGKWYVQKWLPQSYISPEELFQDYTHIYVYNNNGSVTAYINGRDSSNLCFSYTMLLETTSTPASVVSDYWVMITDYTGYAVVYGCRERNAWGQCTSPDSWIWSRTPQLKDDKWAIVNATIKNLCLPEAKFVATQQINDCSAKVASSGQVLMHGLALIIALAFLTCGLVACLL